MWGSKSLKSRQFCVDHVASSWLNNFEHAIIHVIISYCIHVKTKQRKFQFLWTPCPVCFITTTGCTNRFVVIIVMVIMIVIIIYWHTRLMHYEQHFNWMCGSSFNDEWEYPREFVDGNTEHPAPAHCLSTSRIQAVKVVCFAASWVFTHEKPSWPDISGTVDRQTVHICWFPHVLDVFFVFFHRTKHTTCFNGRFISVFVYLWKIKAPVCVVHGQIHPTISMTCSRCAIVSLPSWQSSSA